MGRGQDDDTYSRLPNESGGPNKSGAPEKYELLNFNNIYKSGGWK